MPNGMTEGECDLLKHTRIAGKFIKLHSPPATSAEVPAPSKRGLLYRNLNKPTLKDGGFLKKFKNFKKHCNFA